MRLSTSTNLVGSVRNGGGYAATLESMRRCRAAGFETLDMTFCQMTSEKSEFTGDDWLDRLYELREEAIKLGVTFSQSHLPFFPGVQSGPDPENPGFYERFLEWMRRAVIGSGILGVKWAVVHPLTEIARAQYDGEANLKLNLAFYRPFVELAKQNKVGIAFENLYEFALPAVKRLYGSTAEEVIEISDAFADPAVGVCWDFGHGNLMYADQSAPLRKIGKRLKATHVADNRGNIDAHLAPFVGGTVAWEVLVPLLTEIGYEGDFTYEALRMTDSLPDCLKDEMLRTLYHIGTYCLSLTK